MQVRRQVPAAHSRWAVFIESFRFRANRAWLRARGIAATIPERDDQKAHRRKEPGRPIDFGDQQQERYKGRDVVERCFNRLKQWRGIAMRPDKLLRSYRAAVSLAATLIWIESDLINTAWGPSCGS